MRMNGSQPGSDNDSSDSRKRPLEHDTDSGQNKRHNADNVHFKVLIPSIAAGAIIGKGGEAIARIQQESGAKVKMSKANDFYRGTTERVCVIVGTVEAIRCVHNYMMDRILEKPDPNPKATSDGRLNVERHKQVKILVPNSTAGMIIGKGGGYINEIKEQSNGAYIQVSQKSKEVNLMERCVTVAGDKEQNRMAVDMILAKIAEDPQSASCPNISYSDVNGPLASAYPTGSPYAMPGSSGQLGATSALSLSTQTSLIGIMGAQQDYYDVKLAEEDKRQWHMLLQPTDQGLTSPPLSLLPSPGSSFNLSAAPSHHTMFTGQSQGASSMLSCGPISPSTHQHAFTRLFSTDLSDTTFQSQLGGATSSPFSLAHLRTPSGQVFGSGGQLMGSGATFGGDDVTRQHQAALPMQPGHIKKDIQVNESLVGVVLGQQGRSIVELQASTSTNIQVSKKGVYAPGTRNRVVTLSGAPPDVSRAAILINQRVQNEEQRRQQMAKMGGNSPGFHSATP